LLEIVIEFVCGFEISFNPCEIVNITSLPMQVDHNGWFTQNTDALNLDTGPD